MGIVARLLGAFITILIFAWPVSRARAQPGSASDLAGLWEAERLFGPDLHGTLILEQTASGWTAEVAGRSVEARLGHDVMTCEIPDGRGSFRGKLAASGTEIVGHWSQSRTVFNGWAFATPVRLKPDGLRRWRSEVMPFEDSFTLYLMVRRRDDGPVEAYLRNPERNFGIFLNLTRLTRDGDVVKLLGRRPGREADSEVATEAYDDDNGVLSLYFPSRGGTYDFTRASDLSDFYPRKRTPAPYVYRPPPARDDGWSTGTLGDARIERTGIEKFIRKILETPMDSVHAPEIHGVLIARHGKLDLEEYFHGFHRDQLHDTRSAAKSLTSTLVGAAIQKGAPLDVSTPCHQVANFGFNVVQRPQGPSWFSNQEFAPGH